MLRRLACKLDRDELSHRTERRTSPMFGVTEFAELPFAQQLDWRAAHEGRLAVRFSALDPVWNADASAPPVVRPLREHMRQVCYAAGELDNATPMDWHPVFEQLRLAFSLNELSADTDIHQFTFMCRSAGEYEGAASEVAAKHLAGIIVFNLVWTAYEAAVETAGGKSLRHRPKGAFGRDLLCERFADRQIPILRQALLDAIEHHPHAVGSLPGVEVRAALRSGNWAALAAEHLRRFRNDAVHGKIRMPEPEDWGEGSAYKVDDDPRIKRFASHIRLTLILIQAMMMISLPRPEEDFWLSDREAVRHLKTLHLIYPDDGTDLLFEELAAPEDVYW